MNKIKIAHDLESQHKALLDSYADQEVRLKRLSRAYALKLTNEELLSEIAREKDGCDTFGESYKDNVMLVALWAEQDKRVLIGL